MDVDATGLDSASRDMVPEDQRLLADGGVASKLTEDDVRSLVMASAGAHRLLPRLESTVPWIPCLRLWLLIVWTYCNQ